MKGILLSFSNIIYYKDLPEPVLNKDGWVKIKVKATGLCGSDVQKINSPEDYLKKTKNFVLGHEFSGIIDEVQGNDYDFSKGDRVTAIPLIPCYLCASCKKDNWQICTRLNSIGKTLPGSFAEYVLVPGRNIRKIPENLSYEEAALTDVVAVAVHSYRLAGAPIGRKILILGDGAVALTSLQVFQYYGNYVDIVGKHNKDLIESLDSTFVHFSKVKELSSNSYDIILEAVGGKQNETIHQSIRLVKPKGRIIVLGVFKDGHQGKILYRDLFYKEAILQGSNSYELGKGNNEFDIALKMLETRAVDVLKIISHVLSLENFHKGLELVNQREKSRAIKVVFKI